MTELLPLSGLHVLDLGRGGATSHCSHLLGQLGCDVHSDQGSMSHRSRQYGHFDLIVTDSEDPAVLAPDDRPKPNTVVVSITPYGLNNGDTDIANARAVLNQCRPDVAAALAGAHAALAGLAALRLTRQDGRRRSVEIAVIEVLATCLGPGLAKAGCPRRARCDTSWSGADSQIALLACADGFVGLTPTPNDRDLLATLTEIESLRDPGADLARLLAPWLETRTRAEVVETAQAWRLPIVPVLTPDEVRLDEQSAARGVWMETREDGPAPRSPFRFHRGEATARSARRPAPLPLGDVRVLDLGMVWAGPYCGRLLGGLGAQVTKVEGPARPDGTRAAISGACQGVFADLNRGKHSLVIDLRKDVGREVFLRLATQADAVIENFSPRVMPNFGLDFATLSKLNPGMLTLSMPAFGASGPWANRVAYGGGLELASGLVGYENGQPLPSSVAYLDYLSGCYGAVGVVAALLARDRLGQGAHLELAQREVACQLLGHTSGDIQPAPAFSVDPASVIRDPLLAVRGLLGRPDPAREACEHYARLPFRLHGVPSLPQLPAPGFGADSRRMLTELGLPPDDSDRLVKSGIVVASDQAIVMAQ